MKNHRNIVFLIVGFIAVLLFTYYFGRLDEKVVYKKEFVKITQKQIDSIKSTVKPIEKEVIKYKDRVQDLKDKVKDIPYPEECEEIVQYKDSIIHTQDTIIVKQDSVIYLWKEIEDKQQDIINVLPKIKKQKRFGIGVQGGYGVTQDGFGIPYIGIGASYNLIRF